MNDVHEHQRRELNHELRHAAGAQLPLLERADPEVGRVGHKAVHVEERLLVQQRLAVLAARSARGSRRTARCARARRSRCITSVVRQVQRGDRASRSAGSTRSCSRSNSARHGFLRFAANVAFSCLLAAAVVGDEPSQPLKVLFRPSSTSAKRSTVSPAARLLIVVVEHDVADRADVLRLSPGQCQRQASRETDMSQRT
jgi:hypothetical protein